jgi:hypothetical protein
MRMWFVAVRRGAIRGSACAVPRVPPGGRSSVTGAKRVVPPAAKKLELAEAANDTAYGLRGSSRRSAEQNADRERAKRLVKSAKRSPEPEEDDDDDDGDRPREILAGTYYGRPRLERLLVAGSLLTIFSFGLLCHFAMNGKNWSPHLVIPCSLTCVVLLFMIFDVLREGG